MKKINFTDAVLDKQGYVNIMDVEYPVTETTYTGGTNLDADTFNTMQDNIEEAIDGAIQRTFKSKTVWTTSPLNAGDNYQLSLPDGAIFVEPLIQCSGNATAGGSFVAVNGGYIYCNNIDNPSNGKTGIWVRCSITGEIAISEYNHCGNKIVGFRIWYFG